MRKSSPRKSILASTTSGVKRKIQKALIHGYGKKGTGWLKNPKKAAHDKIYNKTSFSIWDLFK